LVENRHVKRIVFCTLLCAIGLAEQPQASKKPACNAAMRGRFWPDQANSNPQAVRELSRCGALDICTGGNWRYRWRPVTVNVRQLGKTPQEPTAACAAVIAQFGEQEHAAPAGM
jgi:hypothetical protein